MLSNLPLPITPSEACPLGRKASASGPTACPKLAAVWWRRCYSRASEDSAMIKPEYAMLDTSVSPRGASGPMGSEPATFTYAVSHQHEYDKSGMAAHIRHNA